MEPLAILQADPLDLLFENRNKSYGAYPLRKYYPQRLMISIGVVMSLVVFLTFIYLYRDRSSSKLKKLPVVPDIRMDNVFLIQDVKPVIPPLRPYKSKPMAAVGLTKPVIVPDQNIPKPMPAVDQIETSAIGLKTVAGSAESGEPPVNAGASGSTSIQNGVPGESKNEVLGTAEIMPEFPGGPDALKRFLIKNLRMPENNLEEGAQVRVIARFVVGAGGRVRDIEITVPADAGFNAEVKRVISKMPDWKPGSQNHRNVSVYFSLPVNFVRSDY